MIALVFVLIGTALGALSLFGGQFIPVWSPLHGIVSGTLALVFFGVGLLMHLIGSFFIKPSANLAFVTTGLGGRRVLIDRGSFYFPIVQRLIPVSLETMKLEVERQEHDALITKDNLRVDVKAEFYIKVLPDEDSVLGASRSLGEKSVTPQAISRLVFEKLVSALRSVAATKDLVEIHSQRDAFASSVQQLVRHDLEQNGLTLESVTLSRLDQTAQNLLSDSNIFDAQGKRKITEITQSALVERNRLEQEARREITLKNVETGREILALERTRAEVEAAQKAEIAKVQAEMEREAETYRLEQSKLVQQAEIAQEQAVKTAALERDRQVLLSEQEKQRTEVERAKVIAVSEAEKRRADAEKLALEATAQREQASQSVITVQRLAEAEREAQTALVAAKQRIEQDKLSRQTEAEVAAFAEVRRAQAAMQAAKLEADATRTRAEAEAEARERAARGETAFKRVDVDIARESVEVERVRVEVERAALENRETYSEAALEYELKKLQVEAARDVHIEMARATAQFMARGQMNIYGDPETLSRMSAQFTKGMGLGQMAGGVLEALKVDPSVLEGLMGMLGSALTQRTVNGAATD